MDIELNVLVVDDDFMVARLHALSVERSPGLRVCGTAHTGADAIARAEESRPHLVLLDMYLPDLHGLDVLRRIRAGRPDTDFLVITAARDTETVRKAQQSGATGYLIKPFDQRELRSRLEHYRSARSALAGTADTDQRSVDQLFSIPGSGPAVALPKGLSDTTAALVGRVLREHAPDDLSAAECAARTEMSRVSARRYLEYFVGTGQAAVRLRYGQAGRPERRYSWAGV